MNAIGPLETRTSLVAAVQAQKIDELILFVCWSFWMVRRHLWDVWRKVLWNEEEVDDANEFCSYRATVCEIMFCVMYMIS